MSLFLTLSSHWNIGSNIEAWGTQKYLQNPQRVQTSYSVDGAPYSNITAHSDTFQNSPQALFSISGLSTAQHTLSILNGEAALVIDYFLVQTSSLPSTTTPTGAQLVPTDYPTQPLSFNASAEPTGKLITYATLTTC